MKYCSKCRSPVVFVRRPKLAPPHYRCEACGAMFFQNPKLAAGCIADWQGKVLLCRRAVEPGYGLWTLPAGFVERGESTGAGVARETLEEANVAVELGRPYALFHIAHANLLHIIYLAQLLEIAFTPGAESLEVALFDEAELPWDGLAFGTTREVLRRYFADRHKGVFGFHFAELVPFEASHGSI